jgi:uncharacterized membrane protein YadS
MKDWWKSEDWWAVWIGLFLFALSLLLLAGVDALGWGVDTKTWPGRVPAVAPIAGRDPYKSIDSPWRDLHPLLSLALTYVFLLVLLTIGAAAMRLRLGAFALAFTVIFWASYGCWLLGSYAYIAATPDTRPAGVTWSLGLTGEAGYLIALVAGLLVGNLNRPAAAWLKEATRPEWYIKTAIVILGASLGVQAIGDIRLTQAILFRGFAAIIEAYLIYWALVYFIARRFFRFSREWAAPLASGISICGVSAAIATGAAIRARPVVPIMVSSLVVVFSVVELLLLPLVAHAILPDEPMVAAAWMGLAIKTDGVAVASGAITQGLFQGQHEWMLMTTTTVKVFIDIFIGVWAFVLAVVWVYAIDRKPGERLPLGAIWQRFPKFVIGYVITFAVLLALAAAHRGEPETMARLRAATAGSGVFRGIFFVMTFFTIGLVSDFRRLWQEGIARLALVYLVSLFGFIIWIGLVISWVFFHGMRPA